MSKISLFPKGNWNATKGQYTPSNMPQSEIDFDEYLASIKNGTWQDEVLEYRNLKIDDEDEKKKHKSKVRGVTTSGTFNKRSIDGLKAHSGFIAIDIDKQDQINTEDINVLYKNVIKDHYVYAGHQSVGGYGYVIYIKIDSTKHLESFWGIEKYLLNNYKIIIDKSCKDVSRFRFVSYDPDLYLNTKSKVFKQYLKKPETQPIETFIHTESDISHVIDQIRQKRIDLTNNYSDWISIGFALISKYGAGAREYFHIISSQSYKYDQQECDKVFDILSKRNGQGIKINTFFWHCKNAGIDIKTDRTKYIEKFAKQKRKAIGKNGGPKNIDDAAESIKKYLEEIDNIQGDDVNNIIHQVMQLPENELKNDKEENDLENLKIFIKSLGLRFNTVTRFNERDGKQLTDRDLNTIYLQALENVSEKIKKDQLFSLLDSELVEEYNPFMEFFKKYEHLKPEGNFKKLVECIDDQQIYLNDVNSLDYSPIRVENYLEIYLKKWLLSIIGSMHGTYSLMILVLTGKQGNGKTNFFRGLLPDELQPYYAESKLDEGKDSEILMTKKILILDDEFGGKSKQDVKRLKELSSKQWFNIRRPYGRTSEDLQRLAVLCGTSNEEEIINDPTGNRRIIPINLIKLDIEKFNLIDKVELWIELYNEWKENKNGWMLTSGEIDLMNKSTFKNEQKSIEEELVQRYLEPTQHEGGLTVFMSNSEILAYLQLKSNIRLTQTKLGLVLRKLNFTQKIVKRAGAPCRVYFVIKVESD